MDLIGERVEAALQVAFPDYEVSASERDDGCTLGVAFCRGDRRFVAYTPTMIDYRTLSFARWLHRFSEILR